MFPEKIGMWFRQPVHMVTPSSSLEAQVEQKVGGGSSPTFPASILPKCVHYLMLPLSADIRLQIL
jgi:hypothetical protein